VSHWGMRLADRWVMAWSLPRPVFCAERAQVFVNWFTCLGIDGMAHPVVTGR
jgi:hypothetical protein